MVPQGLGVSEIDVNDECDKAFAVRLQWIKEKCRLRATIDLTEEELDKCARGYILYLIGTVVFPDKKKKKIFIYYLGVSKS